MGLFGLNPQFLQDVFSARIFDVERGSEFFSCRCYQRSNGILCAFGRCSFVDDVERFRRVFAEEVLNDLLGLNLTVYIFLRKNGEVDCLAEKSSQLTGITASDREGNIIENIHGKHLSSKCDEEENGSESFRGINCGPTWAKIKP